MVVLVHLKIKALEWSQHFSHYKTIEIFPDTQGELTPQPEVRSGRMLNPSKILGLSLLSARMKRIQQKIKALEWSQEYPLFFRCSRATNSVVGDGILTKFKLIQAFTVVLVTCKNEEGSSKNEGSGVVTTFLPLLFNGNFLKHSGAANSSVLFGSCPISKSFEILWLSSLPARIKKNQSKMKKLEWSQDFPHYNLMGAICCHGNHSSDPISPKT